MYRFGAGSVPLLNQGRRVSDSKGVCGSSGKTKKAQWLKRTKLVCTRNRYKRYEEWWHPRRRRRCRCRCRRRAVLVPVIRRKLSCSGPGCLDLFRKMWSYPSRDRDENLWSQSVSRDRSLPPRALICIYAIWSLALLSIFKHRNQFIRRREGL